MTNKTNTPELATVIVTPDGQQFATKAEAMEHLRAPQIRDALLTATGNNADLADWLVKCKESVTSAFDTGTIRRVSKADKKKLDSSIEALVAIDDVLLKSALGFLIDNSDAVADSFRWPAVRRMTEEEKAFAAMNTLTAAADGNETLAQWVLDNKDSILAAYEAGKVKRKVSPKATEGLAAYRAEKALEKAAREESPEALEAYMADKKVRDDAKEAETAEAAKEA
jgi:hypothetical protein